MNKSQRLPTVPVAPKRTAPKPTPKARAFKLTLDNPLSERTDGRPVLVEIGTGRAYRATDYVPGFRGTAAWLVMRRPPGFQLTQGVDMRMRFVVPPKRRPAPR
jgi:hypothetical protein